MAYSLFFVAILLVIGIILRRNIAVFRWLFIPSSVIAGVVGLAIIQAAFHVKGFAKEQSETTVGILSDWPGWLIAVVFAGMLLESKTDSVKKSARRVVRQGLMVWIIVLGETAVG